MTLSRLLATIIVAGLAIVAHVVTAYVTVTAKNASDPDEGEKKDRLRFAGLVPLVGLFVAFGRAGQPRWWAGGTFALFIAYLALRSGL